MSWWTWCHPAISSSVIPFSPCPQSLPASESFPMSQPFAWGGQSTGVSALASFLPKKSRIRLASFNKPQGNSLSVHGSCTNMDAYHLLSLAWSSWLGWGSRSLCLAVRYIRERVLQRDVGLKEREAVLYVCVLFDLGWVEKVSSKWEEE